MKIDLTQLRESFNTNPNLPHMKIRYNYVCRDFVGNLMPKDTLITIQDGDYIYFGLARCNLKKDHFIKKEGRKYAFENLCDALEDASLSNLDFCIKEVREEGFYKLYGVVNKNNIRMLLRFFDDLADYTP